ncbi:unnamed protein product [Leptidea sinapis]|uniref:Uncharacterized protein n=1 Tax=Leptidea sinapis TaxID=189913 RepID=A0A5E4PUH1_9NEOP|nr:unnamed protein product [Leptidea sinapis]
MYYVKLTCPLTSTKPNSNDKSVWWGPELDRLRCKVRKLFNRAKKYWGTRFNRRIRERKRESWRCFCINIESTNQAAKVKNILSRDPERYLGCLKKSDGTYTKSNTETCELLLQTHFPGCRITNNQTSEEASQSNTPDQTDWTTAFRVVDKDKVGQMLKKHLNSCRYAKVSFISDSFTMKTSGATLSPTLTYRSEEIGSIGY